MTADTPGSVGTGWRGERKARAAQAPRADVGRHRHRGGAGVSPQSTSTASLPRTHRRLPVRRGCGEGCDVTGDAGGGPEAAPHAPRVWAHCQDSSSTGWGLGQCCLQVGPAWLSLKSLQKKPFGRRTATQCPVAIVEVAVRTTLNSGSSLHVYRSCPSFCMGTLRLPARASCTRPST